MTRKNDPDKVRGIFRVQLRHDMRTMRLNRPFADTEMMRSLFVGRSFDDLIQDLSFALCQRRIDRTLSSLGHNALLEFDTCCNPSNYGYFAISSRINTDRQAWSIIQETSTPIRSLRN
jgi:hypothetical protein